LLAGESVMPSDTILLFWRHAPPDERAIFDPRLASTRLYRNYATVLLLDKAPVRRAHRHGIRHG